MFVAPKVRARNLGKRMSEFHIILCQPLAPSGTFLVCCH